jgi:hypothetical protein
MIITAPKQAASVCCNAKKTIYFNKSLKENHNKPISFNTVYLAFCMILFTCFAFNTSYGQKTGKNKLPKLTAANKNNSIQKKQPAKPFVFAQKIAEKRAEYLTTEQEIENEASSVEEREQFEFNMLKDPATGKVPRMAWKKALDAAQLSPTYESLPASQKLLGTLNIDAKGPTNLGGRTRAIGIDKRNANIMIAGSVSSGVYRTTDGGTSWTRVVPVGAIHNITSIAQDTRAGFEDIWYFGGGEASGNSAGLGASYLGFGIWKSTDNGVTWVQLASTASNLESFNSAFDFINRIVVNPVNGDIYAAACNTIQRSTNGGTTWSLVLGTLASNAYTDIIVTPAGRLYAAFAGSVANDEGVWTSTTGASGSWTKIAGTIASVVTPATWNAAAGYGRVVLNYAPSATNIVYALYYRNFVSACPPPGTAISGPEAKFFRYDQSTATWTDLSANLPDETGCLVGNDPFAVQGGYDLAIAVKPDNPNTVFIGGTNIYRSTDGFTTTTNTTRIGGYNSPANYALYPNSHPDIHTLVFANGDNNTLYAGDDGGIQKADITGGAVTWTPLNNNYVTYQYYHADLVPTGGSDILVGGAQDNGTTLNTGSTTASSILGGDGVAVGFMSYTNPTTFNIIAGSQNGSLVRLTGPSLGFGGIAPTGAGSIFVTYFNVDQDNTNHLFYAGNAVLYRTRIANTITSGTLTADAATGWEQMTGTITGNIRSLATSRNKTYADAAYSASNASRKLYIGTSSGKVYRLDDPAYTAASTAPVDITPAGAPAAIVSSIAINPSDDNEIMITYSNYAVNSVYQTANANTATPTWTNIEGPAGSPVQLASARSSAIVKVLGVTQYFVGTSVGLFFTTTLSGATTAWTRIGSTEINFALVSQLRYRPADNKILAATHGNGMFLITLPDPFVLAIKLQSFNAVKQGDNAAINWKVGFSSTAKKFEVLKSTDGRNFNALSAVDAVSNKTDYNAADNLLVAGANYYKLKMTDEDGSLSYSNTAVVYHKYRGFEITSMIPTLVTSNALLSIATHAGGSGSLAVIDAQGKQVYNQQIKLLAGNNNFNLNFSNLSAGAYYIYAFSSDGKSNVTRFVKE